MMFSRDKEDDDDFFPIPNHQSNLASVFGNSGSDGNSSLTYTAPKQPKRLNKMENVAKQPTSSTTTVILVKVVHTFKMVDKKYQSQGKMGAAVLGGKTCEEAPYQLLLYREKKQPVCTCTINKDFQFLVQPKNYCTFFDNQRAVWSILFDNVPEMTEFTFQVALAKWRADDSKSVMMVQDLWQPLPQDQSTSSAEVGDSVELSYSLYMINDTSEVFQAGESVTVVVEEGGWKQGLVGVQRQIQRVIIVQSHMLGDLINCSNGLETLKCPVVIKLTAIQVIKFKNRHQALHTEATTEEQNNAGKAVLKSMSQPTSVESSVAHSSHGGSPKPNKADLISRISRMGQALPFKTATLTPSDSDDTEEDQTSRLSKVDRAVPKPRTRVQQSASLLPTSSASEESTAVSMTVPVLAHHQWGPTPYLMQSGSVYPAPQLASPVDSGAQFNMYLSEVRTTNSELRMGLTRLTDKVDALHTKMEKSYESPKYEAGVSSMLENFMENDLQLKNQLSLIMNTLNNTMQNLSQNKPSGEPFDSVPLQSCMRCLQHEQSVSSYQDKIKKLEEENEYLQTNVIAQKHALQNVKIADQAQLAQIERLQKQIEEERNNVLEVNEMIQKVKREKENLAEALKNSESVIEKLQNTIQERQTSIDNLEQALKDSEATSLEEVRRNLQKVLDPKPVVRQHLKYIMNTVYKFVKMQFTPNKTYDSYFIQSTLAETIKAVTLEYLENGDFSLVEKEHQLLSADQVGQTKSTTTSSSEEDTSRAETANTVEKDYLGEAELEAVESQLLPELVALPKTAVTSSHLESSCTHNCIEVNYEDKLASHSMSQMETKNNSTTEVTLSSPVTLTKDSDGNVVRLQPPPLPLFNEDELDDEWIHT